MRSSGGNGRCLMKEKQAEEEVASLLREAGFEFYREPTLGGLRPDFLVKGPSGEHVVVEVKAWDPRGGNTARAMSQSRYLKLRTRADHAVVVLPLLQRNFRESGVVSTNALIDTLALFFEHPSSRKGKVSKPARRATPTVFAAMPFDRKYDDTYFVALSYAAEKINAACTRVDRTEFSGDIVEEIKRLIHSSIAVVVDLSESKPNVLYEAGFSHALRKPTVHICSTPLEQLPFDVRNWNTLPYKTGQTSALRDPLAKRLASALRSK
jgi:hypothetical protein